MTGGGRDALEMLLPGAADRTLDRAHRIATFLRLLVDDARARDGEAVGLGLDRARAEMERHQGEEVRGLLEDLLLHHLIALGDPGAFLQPARPGRTLQAAWSALETHRRPGHDLPAVPDPREGARAVMDRVLAHLRAGDGGPDPRTALWAAWRATVRRDEGDDGVRKEDAFRGVLDDAALRPLPREVAVACIGAVARCRLDRGAVRAAATWLDEHLGVVSSVPALSWLLAWTQVLGGDPEAAANTIRGLDPPGGTLPTALGELRARIPEWGPLLPGSAVEDDPELLAEACPSGTRREWGAVALAVFAVDPARRPHLVHLDAAPALVGGAEAWARARGEALGGPGEPEHRLLVTAEPVADHRRGRTPLEGALGPSASLAVVRAPLVDEEGEVRGWIHLECEHHLLPPRARLRALAAYWRAKVAVPPADRDPRPDHAASEPAGDAALPGDDPRAATGRRLVARLAWKTAMRRWWCFDVQGDEVVLAAEGGGALGTWRRDPGGARALGRALLARAPLSFPEPSPDLSLAAATASGIVVPLVDAGGVRALLVVESTRRSDFRPRDVERLAEVARSRAPAWRVAQFRAWHRARFGHDVHLDPQGIGMAAVLADLPITGRARSPVALVGPEGVGKEVLARWVHFEGDDPAAPIHAWTGGLDDAFLPPGVGDATGGTVVLDGLADLSPSHQLRLLERLVRGTAPAANQPRLVATLRRPLALHVGENCLRPDLAAHFQRLELRIPPLCDRRDEIPPLVNLLLARFAAEEGIAPARLADDAMALLWRQPWPGNVRELEGVVYRIAVFHAGETVAAPILAALAERQHLDLLKRLPSRRPRSGDLRAALRVTKCASGSINKTRAALYLGWDPDTLSARLREGAGGRPREPGD